MRDHDIHWPTVIAAAIGSVLGTIVYRLLFH